MSWRGWIWIAVGVLALGCGSGSGGGEKDSGTSLEPKTGDRDLEVAAFEGGYGIDFYQQCAKEYEAKNPGLKIKVWGDPRVWEKLRPRFVGGDPPDLTFPGWGMDHWALAEEGQLTDLTEALKQKAAEGDKTWGETFDPNILKLGQLEGKQYVLPYYIMLFGWWFDPKVFAANGWTPPKTWDDLLALGEKIKAKGIAPITFQGKYPYYMIDGMLLPWCQSVGGADAVRNAQNLEPGAWKSEAMLKAAQMIDELNKKGFLQKGAVAMSHTEAQQEFLQGRAAMVPCGSWLYSEMKNVMPPSAAMEFFLPPSVTGGEGDPTAMMIGIEPWMVPSAAKNPGDAVGLFKYMTSLGKAKEFVEKKGTLMAITGSDEVALPEVLKAPAKLFKESKTVYAVQYRQWYPAFNTEIENALTAMLNGDIDPQGFCDRVEAAAEKTRNDASIPKHKVAG
ncbi:MAG TPA: extracellular solute-binding protein [Fimbriimonadaceae bacterium]|nr:extracellular solute-binding protein [Fimbriimonadaceae bacterium]